MTARGQDAPPADVFAAPAPRVYSIDAGRPFLADLARGLLASLPADPLALADVEILLPTRRAARALIDAFVAAAPGGRASLLPRLRPLGDADEDEIALDAAASEDDLDLPPAVSPLERRLVLARMVAAADRAFAGQENWPAAIAAAQALAGLLDSFYTEEIGFAKLEGLVPAEHAAHWARSAKFLEIVAEAWPDWLAARGAMDPAERRARLIRRQAERLARLKPGHPIVVAGTTGSAPAVAALMGVVAGLPRGAVVLPGLDRALARDEKAWGAIDDPHPQAGLKALVEKLAVAPGAVRPWPGSADQPADGSPRGRLVSLALRPAEATDDWLRLVNAAAQADPGLARACAGLSLVEAADEEAEAAAAALIFRETLETPGETAMLVTPDRNLARRVAARMRRWGVAVDDSAGVPFTNSPCGTYLRLAAAWLAAPSDPHATLALARHPLAGFGLDAPARRRAVRALDRGLRGLAPGPGVAGLRARLDEDARRAEAAAPLLAALESAAAGWPDRAKAPFTDFLLAHLAAAEALAARADEPGAERLWRGEDGEAGAALLAELRDSAEALGEIAASDYPPAFSQLLAGASVRRRVPTHPRLSILGPLEARLQSADVVILGGLNEGVWPGEAEADPFLSRPMRRALGLPSPERRIGLSAHDFAQLAAAPEVALLRAARAGGAPAKPSRWIVRLKNILAGAGVLDAVDRSARFAAWARALDEAGPARPVPPPAPRPPLAARPRALSVTRIETWLRDPYAIYARYVLGLRKLDPVGETFGAKHLGSLLHKTFEDYAREYDSRPIADIFAAHAPAYGYGPVEAALWGPLVADSLDWFARFHAERLAEGAPAALEAEGETAIPSVGGPFILRARADRIDLLKDGAAFVYDYKSTLPTARQMKLFRMQLPLTALIVEAGGFAELGARPVAGFLYLKTVDRKGAGETRGAAGADAAEIVSAAKEGIARWIAAFDDPDTPYLSQPRAEFVDDYGDYDRLARRREWGAQGEGEAP
ncbi:double-strand break repair protein AddB [Amphiplicatus metriothermophilus]|uniref:ATP-dependent helicase/nuclease subunit B n=1 Tax=Amphiplicatus metriothermophilus TaxID=1519374 RepID=A0A239PLF5_9PROT|nr:double-strand break repair protein AddB [Amphiplicatus metriothermophilus]MBB5517496.1 ATP-dependent helicase/nuclease subunit B [Amphiplicatus metriothermophilus]SNT68169.1 ATP-dependent helicase/nuclease subunit B [Amphiplicatus metriothermophilus]